ncbi:cadherin-like domain-containing protein, partial [Candidatus Peregrinibacteria bacterium]|nr:cadherin-like domain-containing protein [Candidatus Peregrinibacteria bacterium]
GTATDADGDSIVDEEFQFLINGVTAQPFSTDNTFTCSAPDCVRDKKLSCQYKAGDGIELSSLAEHSADLIVSNTPPTVTGAIISANSNPVTRESSISCTGQGMNDVDNDPNIVHYFQFYFDGVGRGGFLSSNSNTLTVNCADTTHVPSKQVRCVKGEPVHCEYYANDRPATSSVVTSSNVLSLVNAIPQANDLAISVDEDTSELISLDTYDADGDSLTVSVSQPAKGEVTNHNDGTVTFNPNNEFNYLAPGDSEIITFTYSVNDGTVDSSIGTVTLTVSGVNTPPTVTSSPITSATEDTIYSYTLIAGDVEGDALTISSTTLPSWLTLTDNGDNTATLVGTPLNEDVGSNSVSLLIEDAASSVTQVFTINVINTNDVPVASNQLVKVILPSTTNPVIANPTNHDELYAFFDFDDDDLDLESDSEILWYKDNVLQSVLGTNTYVVPPAKTANGENWHFTVRPGDGIGLGTLVTSNSVLIGSGNAPPLVEVSHISGTDFYDTLSIPFTYSDTNNDVLTFTLEESLDQLTWNVVEDNIASSPYSWSLPSRDGDTYIRISASDGVDSTVSNSVLVVLDNTCSCDSCASCELKLSRPTSWCSEISLTQSLSGVDTCIADPSNINGKTFDCDNNPVVGLNSGNFFELDSKSDVTIENCELSNFRYGFDIDNSNNIDIVDNTVSSTSRNNILISASTVFVGRNILHDAGSGFQSIYVSEGLNVNLENNEIYSCDEGIILSNSNSNIVNKNNIHDVSGDAISLFESDGNVISSNRLINNGQGINLIQSATNLIFDNYLSDNTRNAFDAGNNFWFTSPESGTNVVGGSIIAGNYWSDLTCNDAGDGICEEDYTIGVNIDEHPLVSS